ncbi:molybdopterin cofactor-binding domain-containing protein [Pararhizobium mangrovi]|uniref:Aldehyde dehydrogenase n=1 Tax=Pararhizobium mangrovi TaxID=2590452 RepID=A0A506TUT5_9HYPH|nr:molybdopterin cofactor-binding domain-containing protein [Pararhizobium mangrovi]TPW25822.1 aldehyde dehydrogenase [Pararhizobium mangrovi]
MTRPEEPSRSRYLEAAEGLVVTASATDPTLYLALHPGGGVTAFNGHVDLGTGIRTALAQIVAEELDVPFDRVRMVLGSTQAVPDQGPTIASETIQVTAKPLRQAAATARRHLLACAAHHAGCEPDELEIVDGIVSRKHPANWAIAIGELVRGQLERIALDADCPVKPVSAYRLVGTGQARTDIPEKATGRWAYVHDVRLHGMLHGRVIRPPHTGFDHGEHVAHNLLSVNEDSLAGLPGIVDIVVVGDFVGVVAEREEQAARAADLLDVRWRKAPAIADLSAPEDPLRDHPASARVLADNGNVERGLDAASSPIARSYVWPYQMHASIGPSCAVAEWSEERLTVWSGTQNPRFMQRDLALLFDMPEDAVTVERMEAAGCYGRNCADDVTADAALLSQAVGRPVRVQLTREQEHGWEPKGAAQVVDVRGGLDLEGGPAAYDFETRYPSNLAPTLALILTGRVSNVASVTHMGDRTAIPPYAFDNMRVTVHDMPPLARASWFRGVSAMPNSFAHESFIDELASAAEVDPVEYRLRYLTDPRAIDLVHAVTERAGWTPRTKPMTMEREGDVLYGRGFAYALYVHGTFPGTAAAWSAWVADVAVNCRTGEIAVTRVTVGQDSGLMINPEGVRHQIHGNVIQSTSRVLKEKVEFSQTGVESLEWGGYPIIQFPEVPEIDVVMLPRPDEEPLGVGESASVPSAAAIVNAVFDATGIRFRELPLTPDKVLAALRDAGLAREPEPRAQTRSLPAPTRTKSRRSLFSSLAGVAGGLLAGGFLAASPWHSAIRPIVKPDPATYSAMTIARGREVAAAGACDVCHTGVDGTPFAGGRAFETPFGTVRASNISSSVENGIGAWSYPAFERAMRRGISRDGSHLYPVHPYPSFAGTSDADLQALYAFMMTQRSIDTPAPKTALSFPFNVRSLMAGWNALFAGSQNFAPDPQRTERWNRGAYLVETLGHCSACHSPRNALGASRTGADHLAGGFAEGWHAPALNGEGPSPIGWSEAALYDYLRTGTAADHGSAGGPMSSVVASLAPLPDTDIRAMATYLASFSDRGRAQGSEMAVPASDHSKAVIEQAAREAPAGNRIFEGACASCHENGAPIASLSAHTALHAETPDNVVRTILKGATAPALLAPEDKRGGLEVMAMPAFAKSLSDRQIGNLVRYLRARYAPDAPSWQNVEETIAQARKAVGR